MLATGRIFLIRGPIASIALALFAILGAANAATAQQTGRIFPYKWLSDFPIDEVTTADIQHALIWTEHYGAMVDGAYGRHTRRAIAGWLSSKGYSPSDDLSRQQSIELITDGMRKRDAYGWSTLSDSSVGFSVGIPTRLSTSKPVAYRDGMLWYDSEGLFEHHVSVMPQSNACVLMDGYFTALLNLPGQNRQVTYQARKDDWFVLSGESGAKRFYTRAQCRQQGVVTVVVNVPTTQVETLGFLFTAMSNSLSLRPVLNPRGPAAARIDPPPPPPGGIAANSSASRSPFPMPPAPIASFDIDKSGKTTSMKLTLGDGQELRPQDVFARASDAVFVVRAQDRQGSAVAISDHELLTNCHVIGAAPSVTLHREGQTVQAKPISANVNADRCVLRTEVSLPRWAKVRPFSDIKVGERVYTIGAPQGLELTLAEGLVSSKRILDGDRLVQTTAPISSGSSGGGLFDAQANLVAITTFMLKQSQNLNFAIAAEEYAK